MTAARIRKLSLTNFRSYRAASLSVDAQLAVLIGPNGAGKTNLIEAISFFAPGRGLRRATLDEVAFSEGDGSWAVAAELEGALGLATLGTGIEPQLTEAESTPRKCRIDGEPAPSAAAFTDHVSVVWMTPAMDALFAGPASERRRFLDRLVLAVDGTHSSRVNALERSLRSRNRLLEQPNADAHWLDAIEHETAEVAVAVAAARAETVRRLATRSPRNRDPPLRPSRGPASRSMDGSRTPCWSCRRPRWRTATAPFCATTARATPLPGARPTARISPISKCCTGRKALRRRSPQPASRRRC